MPELAPPLEHLVNTVSEATNQIRTISKQRIRSVLGRLSDSEAEALDRALRIQLALV